MMNLHVAEHIKAVIGSSSVVGGLSSGLLGLAASAGDIIKADSNAIVFAVCAIAGALLANIPKIMTARTNARASESEFIGIATRRLIDGLEKRASDTDEILALNGELRHKILGAYNAAVLHIDYLENYMRDHGMTDIPPFKAMDSGELLHSYDREVLAIKRTKRKEP